MRRTVSILVTVLLALTLAACDQGDVNELQEANDALASEVTELRNNLESLQGEWETFGEEWTAFSEDWNAFVEAEGPFGE